MAAAAAKKYQIDMTNGPLFSKLVLFVIPLMLSSSLQLLFHAVDLIVLGHYAPYQAMAAVGCTTAVQALIVNLSAGAASGANVFAARYFGAGDHRNFSRTLHTSMAFALYGGIILTVIGLYFAGPLLRAMKTPKEVYSGAYIYLQICYLSIPFQMLYSFGSSVLRAVGDTRRPMVFLLIAGVVNAVLNLFFVRVCHWNESGVAIATLISHALSAWLVLRTFLHSKGEMRFEWRLMRFDREILRKILRIGIPAGIQSSCFSVSNMIIQSSINSFGPVAMAGNTAETGVESILHVSSAAFYQAAISFNAQNHGAGKMKRILWSIFECMGAAFLLCTVTGWSFYFFGNELLGIFNPDPEVIAWGMKRAKIMFCLYMFIGVMEAVNGSLRGLGCSVLPMISTLFGACVFRIWWVWAVFPRFRTMEGLMLSYPISWILVALFNGVVLYFVCRKIARTLKSARGQTAFP